MSPTLLKRSQTGKKVSLRLLHLHFGKPSPVLKVRVTLDVGGRRKQTFYRYIHWVCHDDVAILCNLTYIFIGCALPSAWSTTFVISHIYLLLLLFLPPYSSVNIWTYFCFPTYPIISPMLSPLPFLLLPALDWLSLLIVLFYPFLHPLLIWNLYTLPYF